MEKRGDQCDFTFYRFSNDDGSFEHIGSESIEIKPQLFSKSNEFKTQPKFFINHLNNQQLVISFLYLLESSHDNSKLGNRYREHYIYRCDLWTFSYIEKIVCEKSILSHFVPDLEVIFQNENVVYLEKSIIQSNYSPTSISDKIGPITYYRMEYWFNDELKYEIKLHPYRLDMVPWLDENLNVDIISQIELPNSKIKQNATKLFE